MFTVKELRLQMGMSQRAFAKQASVSIRSVINWETGKCMPSTMALIRLRAVARAWGLTNRTRGPLPINFERMRYYLGKPGSQWLTMTGQQRAAFYFHRARYAHIKRDIQSGLAHPSKPKSK